MIETQTGLGFWKSRPRRLAATWQPWRVGCTVGRTETDGWIWIGLDWITDEGLDLVTVDNLRGPRNVGRMELFIRKNMHGEQYETNGTTMELNDGFGFSNAG